MKLALIPPFSLLGWQEDCAFILAQHLHNRKYMEFYRRLPLFKILDHGGYEEERVTDFEEYIKLAIRVKADEVIFPDILRSSQKTIDLHKEFLPIAMEHSEFSYMIIPQGRNPQEWRLCCDKLTTMVGLDTIQWTLGVPIWLDRYFNARAMLVRAILSTATLTYKPDIHLLGLDNYYELLNFTPGIIRSVDTSLPFSLAWSDLKHPVFEQPKDHIRVPMEAKFSEAQIGTLESLVNQLAMITHEI